MCCPLDHERFCVNIDCSKCESKKSKDTERVEEEPHELKIVYADVVRAV